MKTGWRRQELAFLAGCIACGVLISSAPARAAGGNTWQPARTVDFIVPAGTGGGADQMAREVQGLAAKYKLMKEPMVVLNEPGGAGAQGFLDIKGSKRNPYKLVITLSNLFTTPLATGVPFNWKDFTPIAMLELDEFVLWVNADTPYKTAMQYIDAVRKAPSRFRMGGTGSKQEDQIVTAAIEQKTGAKFIYIPYKGGGDVNEQLAGGHVDSTVNNPIEGIANWRAGKIRPLCVFDSERMQYPDKIVNNMSWQDIPTCKEAGLDVQYLMLRGVFTSPDVSQAPVNYYIDLFKKIRATPDWQEFTKKAAFKQQFMTGQEFVNWLTKAAALHEQLMEKAGFLAKK